MIEPVTSPEWLVKKVSNELLRIRYVDATKPEVPETNPEVGFDCWGFVWYYESLTGLVLPLDPFKAEEEFVPALKPVRWRDVVIYQPKIRKLMDIPHCGVMEDSYTMIHCSSISGKVVRTDIMYPPWRDNVRIIRHRTLT